MIFFIVVSWSWCFVFPFRLSIRVLGLLENRYWFLFRHLLRTIRPISPPRSLRIPRPNLANISPSNFFNQASYDDSNFLRFQMGFVVIKEEEKEYYTKENGSITATGIHLVWKEVITLTIPLPLPLSSSPAYYYYYY